ncbi:hypothetical protein ACQBAR_14255 [Propionibacteriaceae bacterium Y1685]|uniref:hypothetical protein n=1 Tax=Microlunatus sp. Y1700 TaxID=3418487 RepID=UPI003B81DC5A
MASYDEILVNFNWFKHEVSEIEARIDPCIGLSFQTGCMNLPDEEWPDALADFRARYEEVGELVSDSDTVGYATGERRLRQIRNGLVTTARSYLRAEAEAEDAISTQILALIEDI